MSRPCTPGHEGTVINLVNIKVEEICPLCQGLANPFYQKCSVGIVTSPHAPPCTCGMNIYVRDHPSILDIEYPGFDHEFKVKDLLKLHPNFEVEDLFEAFMGGNDYRHQDMVKKIGQSDAASKWCRFMYASFFHYLQNWRSLKTKKIFFYHLDEVLLQVFCSKNFREDCIKKFNGYLEELTSSHNEHGITTHKMVVGIKEEENSPAKVALTPCASSSTSNMSIFVKNHPSLLNADFPSRLDDFKVRDLVELYPELLVEDLFRAHMGGWDEPYSPVLHKKWTRLSLWNRDIFRTFFFFVDEWPLLRGRDGTLLYEQPDLFFKNETFRRDCIEKYNEFYAALTRQLPRANENSEKWSDEKGRGSSAAKRVRRGR